MPPRTGRVAALVTVKNAVNLKYSSIASSILQFEHMQSYYATTTSQNASVMKAHLEEGSI